MNQDEQQKNQEKVVVDVAIDHSVNQSRTTEDDPEQVAYQVKIQEKVETTCLFDRGADAHVMPNCVWEVLGEPVLQTTRVTLRGVNGQDLGAIGELHVRSFTEKTKVRFTTVVARDARRCLLSATQLRSNGCTFFFGSTR